MMSQSNSNLPSINDFIKSSDNLPSIDDIILKEFIKEEKVEEIEEPVAEKSGDLTEILRLINDVRQDIPEIPEIKYYDKELEKLCEIVDQVRSEIAVIPEIKYYDAEIETICEQIDDVKKYINNSISELPEVRYYENDLHSIKEEIENVKQIIEKEIPQISWIGKNFSFSWITENFKTIDDTIIKIDDGINTLKGKFNFDLEQLSETIDTKRFESKVEIDELNKNLEEVKNNIWKELGESSLKIWQYHKEFKDDDRKLKKQIVSEYNLLKQNFEEQLKKVNQESIKTDELLLKYFAELKEQVSDFPEVKYYDDEIVDVRKEIGSVKVDINELYKIVRNIKSSQKDLKEGLLNEPPDTKNSDPLTPLDQNFATLDDLQNHYRLFINRIQQQLSALGGGGETRLEFLDDIDRTSAKVDGRFLKYDASSGKWVGGGGSQTLDDTLGLGNTSSLGMSVGLSTVTRLIVDPVGGGTTFTENLVVKGSARVTGILSIGTGTITLDPNDNAIVIADVKIRRDHSSGDVRFLDKQGNLTSIIANTVRVGSGDSSVSLIANNGAIVFANNSGDVVANAGITSTTSINTTGIITASSFVGDGSLLTGLSTSIPLSAITDVDTSNLSGISTDYIMIYDPIVPGFKFVNPKTYFGINNDYNSSPDIVDYGSY
jgi:ethanolamine utilization microcompartment shell protein EutL